MLPQAGKTVILVTSCAEKSNSTDADWTVKFLGDWRSTERDGLVKIRIMAMKFYRMMAFTFLSPGSRNRVKKTKTYLFL